jgi:DNA (cytosine-5)-methyltransferase 1
MPTYYNEIDHAAAEWLRVLIAGGLIPAGTVDERSIVDVRACDLAGFKECHFFAGIGGWPYALHLTDWRGPVWTGSCPCQPLSSAGQRRGHADERHLWPAFHRLIAECRPATIFGEQVASKDGREWLAGVRADLEHLGYAVGAADLPAAGVGAPHIRQRLFWVADADATGSGGLGRLRLSGNGYASHGDDADGRSAIGGLGDAHRAGSQGRREHAGERADQRSSWATGVFIPCLDGKSRRIGPGIFPLAHGVSARVGRLRGYGNAIVPQVAAEFVTAFMECRGGAPRDRDASRITNHGTGEGG